jgi:hypothetical protein
MAKIKAEKTMRMFMLHRQYAGLNHNININNGSIVEPIN